MNLMISNYSSTAHCNQSAARLGAIPSMQRRMLKTAKLMAGFLLFGTLGYAQTAAPIVLPNTLTTVAGSANGTAGVSGFTVGGACSPGSPYKATDIYGDGCLATQAVFGTDLQDGIRVDGQGNLYIADVNNNWANTSITLIRRVDAKSGIVSLVSSSLDSLCSLATATVAGYMDSQGDGCPFLSSHAPKERGWGIDPYGNLFTGSYSSGEVHIFCNAVSPLCPIAAGVTQTYSQAQKQVGYMYRVAGCVSAGTGATAGTSVLAPGAGDGYFASAFWNLPGDVAGWGPSNSNFNATATTTGTAGTCGATTGELNGGRSVTADLYGNVFIADGSNFRVRVVVGPPTYTLSTGVVLTNPLPAVLQLYAAYASLTPAQMYGRIYPIFGGFTATVAGAGCTSAPGATAVDTFGDGCPWFNTSQSQQAAYAVGLAIDQTVEGGAVSGNVILNDGYSNVLHVLYMGPTVSTGNITAASYPMAHAIFANNPSVGTVTHGYVYLLAGNASGAISATPTLGTATSDSAYTRVTAAPNGNLYLGASSTATTGAYVSLYDLSTGYIRLLIQSTVPVTGATFIPPTVSTGSNTPTTIYTCATPGTGDGLPAFAASTSAPAGAITTNPCFNNNGTGSSQLSLSADTNNNLYIGDVEIDSAGWGRTRIREALASQLFPATIGTPTTQTMFLHGPAGTTASTTAIAASVLNVAASEVNVGTPSCETTANADKTVDCVATVSFSPTAPGLRSGLLSLSDASVSTSSYSLMYGNSTGSALVVDPALPTAAVSTNLAAASASPAGAAVDSNGDVFTMDTAAGKFVEITGGVSKQLSGTLPAGPAQIALDLAGNVYATGSSSTTIAKLTLTGGAYVASTITLAGVSAPQGVAFDQVGNMYVSDKSTSSVYKFAAATLNGTAIPGTGAALPNATPPSVVASSLNVPTSLAVDSYGNLYIADTGSGAIYRVDAKTGITTGLLSSIHPGAIAVDAAGDVYYQDTTADTVVEIPYAGISSGVAGSLSVTVRSALSKPSGLAVAGNGNLYSADSGAGVLTMIARNAFSHDFGIGSSGSATVNGTLTDVGNLAVSGSNPSVNTTNLVLSSSGSTGCTVAAGVLGAQAAGSACSFSANFVGQGTGAVSSVISYLPAASTVGSMTLLGTLTSISGTTTTLAQIGTTVLPATALTLTATVASTSAVTGQTVTFLNGTTVLGTGTTNSSGVATLPFTVGALGVIYNFQATFAGTPLVLGSSASAVQTVTVALTPSVVTLALSATSTYPGQPVTLTATQTPAAVGQTITFLNNGTTTLGTGTINAQGVAIYTLTPTTGATDVITASFASDGKAFAASASAAQTLTIAASAILLSVSPNAITIAPGASGQVTLDISPQGGFAGVVGLACSSPVAYVTCALQFQSVSSTAITNPTATITVAPTIAATASLGSGSMLAMLASLGLLGFLVRSRKRMQHLPRVALIALFAACSGVALLGVAGCSGSGGKAATGVAPSGTQIVTFTSTAAGASETTTVTVLID